ncbi:hypothetical protein ACFXK0_10690 [Nocardia sp. NPDC059177]|uniref:hypothetical protein n=1 Tax=Nocardia sp. NPDC059177 TaxID=3346759 RepID=UPI0036B900F1
MDSSGVLKIFNLIELVSTGTILCENQCMVGAVSLGDVTLYGARSDGTLEKLQDPWTVDHISYLRKSVQSIREGHSNGIWFTGDNVERLSGYEPLTGSVR